MSKINKGTVETIKTVVIAVLITAIVAFIGGMHFASAQEARVSEAAKAAQVTASAPAEAKK